MDYFSVDITVQSNELQWQKETTLRQLDRCGAGAEHFLKLIWEQISTTQDTTKPPPPCTVLPVSNKGKEALKTAEKPVTTTPHYLLQLILWLWGGK